MFYWLLFSKTIHHQLFPPSFYFYSYFSNTNSTKTKTTLTPTSTCLFLAWLILTICIEMNINISTNSTHTKHRQSAPKINLNCQQEWPINPNHPDIQLAGYLQLFAHQSSCAHACSKEYIKYLERIKNLSGIQFLLCRQLDFANGTAFILQLLVFQHFLSRQTSYCRIHSRRKEKEKERKHFRGQINSDERIVQHAGTLT